MVRILKVLPLLLLLGCGLPIKNHRSLSGEAPAGKVAVRFDDSVPSNQRALVDKDLEILSNAGFVDQSEANILDIPDFSNRSLKQWLETRFSYLVGENYDTSGRVERSLQYQPFLSEVIGPFSSTTIMRNAGGAVYLAGKEEGILYSLLVGGFRLFITTPRVGIFQIGEGLFTTILVPGTKADDDINSYLRLATDFHEARHDDGSGDNAAFPHEKCPSGDYEGQYACDKSTDGPYPVGRVIVQKFRNQCTWCTSAQLANLDLQIADLNGRVLSWAVYNDDQAERINP